MEKNQTKLKDDLLKWYERFKLEHFDFSDILIIALLICLILLVLIGFIFNRHHQNKMHTLFNDFFRFYIHVSKPPSKELTSSDLNDIYSKLSLSSVSMSISTPSLTSSPTETSPTETSSSNQPKSSKCKTCSRETANQDPKQIAQTTCEVYSEDNNIRNKEDKQPMVRFSTKKNSKYIERRVIKSDCIDAKQTSQVSKI